MSIHQFWDSVNSLRRSKSDAEQATLFRQALTLAEASPEHIRQSRLAFCAQLHGLMKLPEAAINLRLANNALRHQKATWATGGYGSIADIKTARSEGVSVVTCSMNRNDNLIKAVNTWILHDAIDEIIIVDWSSEAPVTESLAQAGIEDQRIRVIRVEGESRWVLTWAFNVGFSAAQYTKILKADADITIAEDFFNKNRLKTKEFITGSWEAAEPGQEHINGFFYCWAQDLERVGLFNENIQTYGWDDDELYGRLRQAGIFRKIVDVTTIHHLDHDDALRMTSFKTGVAGPSAMVDEFEVNPNFKIRQNEILCVLSPAWNAGSPKRNYDFTEITDNYASVTATEGTTTIISPHIHDSSMLYAAYELLSWRLGRKVFNIEPAKVEAAISTLCYQDITTDSLLGNERPAAPLVSAPKPKFFIDAQHGLGNRMRAIASAAAIANATDRELVVVWQPDDHCEGRLSDLYDYKGAVVEKSFIDNFIENGGRAYNYMEIEANSEKDRAIETSGSKDIYARAAYVLNHEASIWEKENEFLRQLVPTEEVMTLVDSVASPHSISAHVRMVGGRDFEHLSYESIDNWTQEGHLETEKWRKASHFSHFFKRIEALNQAEEVGSIFVAADKPETYDEFKLRFGGKLRLLQREVFDRSALQLKYALADAILLSRSPLLLGSSWSSFSELAMRLSPFEQKIEMSGQDF